jgi:hypothetical protein
MTPMSDAEKPALRPANNNPWYCLATLHGELPEESEWRRKERFEEWPEDHVLRDLDLEEIVDKNRTAWNRWVASSMSDEDRASLVKNGFWESELAPLSTEEESAFRQAFAVRAGESARLPSPTENYDFSFTHFDRPVAFAGFLFSEQIAKFESANFSGRADFRSTRFNAASFDSATFSTASSFESATFPGYTGFHSATFAESASFKLATFGQNISFRKAKFSGFTTFERATFSKEARFDTATFSDYTSFAFVKFKGRAEFAVAKFSRYATFEEATFSQQTNFESARFASLSFESATFDWLTMFTSAKFSGDANFNSVAFNSDAVFSLAKFSGLASFVSATFRYYAAFHYTNFKYGASFYSATFLGDAGLGNAKFGGATSFSKTRFRYAVPDFRGAYLHEATEWHGARWPWPPNGREAAQSQVYAYERLKLEMERLKKHEDEQKFFRMELRARRRLLWVSPFDWFLNWVYQWSSDYGNSFMLPLFWLFVVFTAGTAVFARAPLYCGAPMPIKLAAKLSFFNIFAFLPDRREVVTSMGSCLSNTTQAVSAAQSLLGLVLVFLLGLAVRNRFRMK